MKKICSKLPARQRGSLYVTVFMLVLLGAAVTFALKVVPAYVGNATLKSSFATIQAKAEYKNMDVDEVRRALAKALTVNPVAGFSESDVFIKHDSGREYVDINYEVRTPLAANISVVIEFKNRFDKN